MKKILCLVAITMFLLIGSQAWAQGDVGSVECLTVQLATQTAVESGGPYKNVGALVKAAAQAANPYLYDGTITEECHSCIVNQFARQVPIGEQEACGECPTYDLCSTTNYPLLTCDPCVAAVCALDGFCCAVEWDSICVSEAVDTCGIECGPTTCSAVGACGGQSPAGCYCDEACCGFGDCCPDAGSECGIVCGG